jgi:2C-methyl-D-erythritol 2,4-cyclodiphosphate synthase
VPGRWRTANRKGSIKKSRPIFRALIEAISAAAAEQTCGSPVEQEKLLLQKIKGAANQHRKDLDALRSSLVSRLYEVHELKVQILALEEQVKNLKERLSQASHATVRPINAKGT